MSVPFGAREGQADESLARTFDGVALFLGGADPVYTNEGAVRRPRTSIDVCARTGRNAINPIDFLRVDLVNRPDTG